MKKSLKTTEHLRVVNGWIYSCARNLLAYFSKSRQDNIIINTKILRRNFSVDYLISVEKSTVCLVLLKQINEGFTHVHLQMHPLSLKRYNVTFRTNEINFEEMALNNIWDTVVL